MLTSDFHTHSSFSSDSKTTMEDMVIQGIKLGLTKICFTEHQDFGYPTIEPGMDFQLNIAAYKKQFDLLKEQYKNEIQLLFGIELGMM
ncbi:MAG: PHP domain-containing protein, partial [Lachnospiraceae bacterium]|nr:PHP domain-containing protein [Lachnospiraceae bacterium]